MYDCLHVVISLLHHYIFVVLMILFSCYFFLFTLLFFLFFFFFFFNDPATTEIYTLSLHDALPILFPRGLSRSSCDHRARSRVDGVAVRYRSNSGLPAGPRVDLQRSRQAIVQDRKSTRLNSSHSQISYAVFCLKKKKKTKKKTHIMI